MDLFSPIILGVVLFSILCCRIKKIASATAKGPNITMEKKEVKEDNSKMDNSKMLMERTQKANGQIEVISHLMFVQLFCNYLRIYYAIAYAAYTCAPENDPELQAGNDNYSIAKEYGIFVAEAVFFLGMLLAILLFLIDITLPWSFKVVAKSMVSTRSLTPGWIHGLIYLATMYFQYCAITATDPCRYSASSKTISELLLACNRHIAIIVIICLCFLLYQMYHLTKLDGPKKPMKDEPEQHTEQEVSNEEKITIISMENDKSDVEKMEVYSVFPNKRLILISVTLGIFLIYRGLNSRSTSRFR